MRTSAPHDQRVDGQQTERRRAVDEDVVQRLLVRQDRPLKSALTGHQRHQLDLRTGEIDRGGGTEETLDIRDRLDDLGEWLAVDQHVIDRRNLGVVVDAQRGGGIALRVEVDHQDPATVQGQGGGKVDRGRGLTHPTLLVGDHHDSGLLGPWQALTGAT